MGARHGLFGASLVLAWLAGGCGSPTGPERELSGPRLYLQYCARCHGHDGQPPPAFSQARDLSNPRLMEELDDARIKRVIVMGKPPNMPGLGDRFTDAALEVIVAHVRSLSGTDGSRALAEESEGP